MITEIVTATSPAIASHWRTLAAVLFIIAAVMLLIAWNERQNQHKAARWLNHSALSLETLGLALSLFWAVNAPDGVILPWIFCGGWVGMLIGRSVLITFVVTNWQQKKYSRAWGGIGTLIIAYVALYGSGLFHAINDAGDAAQARLEASKPAQALDAEIANVQARITSLAAFSDATKAATEAESTAAAQAQYAKDSGAINAQLRAAKAKLAKCPPKYFTNCIKPNTEKVAELEAELAALGGGVSGSEYVKKHDEYNGLQTHLVTLQKQRAGLSANGQGVQEAWRPEDVALSEWFGITPAQASRIKWLIATLIFDVLSLLFRVFSSILMNKSDPETMFRRKLDALLNGGFTMQEALAIMNGLMDIDGTLTAKGMETVMQGNGAQIPASAFAYGPMSYQQTPVYSFTPPTVTPAAATAYAPDTAQAAPATPAVSVPTVDMPPAQPKDDTGSKFGFMGTVGGLNPTAKTENTGPADNTARTGINPECRGCGHLFEQNQHDHPVKCWEMNRGNCLEHTGRIETVTETKIIFRDRERVPRELSQKGGAGRAGKIDSCIDCGTDYEVLVHNALRCPTCAEARQSKGRSIYQRTKKP